MKLGVRAWCVAVLCGAWACTGTETGNPSFKGTISYATYSSDVSVAALRQTDSQVLSVDRAWMGLGDARFSRSPDCGLTGAVVAAPALGVRDQAAAETRSEPLQLEASRYCGVHLSLVPTTTVTSDAPAALRDHSMLIAGKLRDGSAFEIRSKLQTDLFLEATGDGFALDAEHADLAVGFDVAHWFADVKWINAVRDTSGLVLVDAEHNATLLTQYEDNVRTGTRLFQSDSDDAPIDPKATPLATSAP